MEKVMLQTHLIAELLDMEAYDFEGVEQDGKQIVLNVRMKRRTQECPACRTPCDQVHDYRTQRVKDSPIQGKTLIWQYRKRRYRCTAAESDSTRAIICYRSTIESPAGWRRWECTNCGKSSPERKSPSPSAYPNRLLGVG